MNFIEHLGISPINLIAIVVVIIVIVVFIVVAGKSKKKAEEKFPLTYKSTTTTATKTTAASTSEPSNIIKSVADALDTNTAEVRFMLGIPLTERCGDKNPEDAENSYQRANTPEEEYVALLKWLELENDVTNMETLYDAAEEYPSIQSQIDIKWIALSLAEIEASTTEDEIMKAYGNAPLETMGAIAKKLYALYQKA